MAMRLKQTEDDLDILLNDEVGRIRGNLTEAPKGLSAQLKKKRKLNLRTRIRKLENKHGRVASSYDLENEGLDPVATLELKDETSGPILIRESEIEAQMKKDLGENWAVDSGLLTREGEIYLMRRISNGDSEAKAILIDANHRMVRSIARKYSNNQFTEEDLIQEGQIGLLKAIEKFDWKKGHKFSTYAYWWVRQVIGRSIQEYGRTVRIPVHIYELLAKMRQVNKIMSRSLGRAPNEFELSDILEIPVQRVVRLIELTKEPISLSAPSGNTDNSSSIENVIQEKMLIGPVDRVEDFERSKTMRIILKTLTSREEYVIRRRFGFEVM
jgi:RNA polymerase primary sigma factor